MALKRISDYTAAGTLDGTELLELETTGGSSVKTTAQDIADLADGVGAAGDITYNNAASGMAATDVQAAIDELAAGGAAVQADVQRMKTAVATGVGASMEYKSEPNLVYMADGNLLCFYRRGSSHVNNDGKIVGKISTDHGATWGAEFDIYDDATGYDTRNPSGGIDPDSGRLVVFFQVNNAGTFNDVGYVTSTDNGATWSGKTSVSSALTVGKVPYGRLVQTSLGLLMSFYQENKCSLLKSTDGGATWSGEVVVYNLTQTAKFNEPMLCAVDDDRVVIVMRDDNSDSFVRFYKSGDGGATWTFITGGAWTATTINTAAPFWAVKVGTDVVIVWCGRHQENKLFYTRVPADLYWEDPQLAMLTNNSPMEPRRRLATALRRYGTISTATDAEFGYPTAVQIPGLTRLLVAWYDSGDGTNTNCSIYAMTTPAV